MINEAIREQFISEHSRCAPETLRTRLFWVNRWLKFVGDRPLHEWNKILVNKFRTQLEKEGKAPLTIRDALGVVKRTFDAAKTAFEAERTQTLANIDPNKPSAVAEALKAISLPGPTWDLGKRDLPRPGAGEINRPALSMEQIGKIVSIAKEDGGFEPPEIAFTVLASLYGLRQGELQAVRREHIDYEAGTIFIMTEKGGEKRKQLLAPGVIPYLQKYEFTGEYSPFLMNQIFKNICAKAGIPDQRGMAWHSFRRRIETALRDSLASDPNLRRDAQLITKIWFRWRLSSSPEMTDRYYTANPLEADKVAIAHHPVLPFWKGEYGQLKLR